MKKKEIIGNTDMFMQVLSWEEFTKNRDRHEPSAVTIGVFDGVHRGHQVLIEKIVAFGAKPTVFTFTGNPKKTINAILSLQQKLDIFESLGILQTILIDFSENFSKLKGQEFIDILLRQANMVYLAIGSNFQCGHKLDMTAPLIKERNESEKLKVEIVPPLSCGEFPISSSRIRLSVSEGKLEDAAFWLGRNFALDVRELPLEEDCGQRFFNAAVCGRIVPPDGKYHAVLYKTAVKEGKKTEIIVKKGKIGVPSHFNVVSDISSIEFLNASQGE